MEDKETKMKASELLAMHGDIEVSVPDGIPKGLKYFGDVLPLFDGNLPLLDLLILQGAVKSYQGTTIISTVAPDPEAVIETDHDKLVGLIRTLEKLAL